MNNDTKNSVPVCREGVGLELHVLMTDEVRNMPRGGVGRVYLAVIILVENCLHPKKNPGFEVSVSLG